MRKITLSTGQEMTVNPLKGKDVRALRKKNTEDGFESLFVTLEAAGFGAKVIDDLPFPDVMALNKAVVAETYGIEDEAKN
ncbi:hypothetical protein [Desulfovibrio porci]|uniref:hypothetical protein n=1 Tax=Desulfovibrio porci TaxID=2605782 RepID=UPI003A9181C3